MPPLFTIPYPDHIVPNSELIEWQTISSWYFGSSQPLYFDMLCQESKLHRFKLIIKPDLSDASLHVINASEITPHDFNVVSFLCYRICEDTLVSCWINHYHQNQNQRGLGLYTGLTSARSSNIISHGGPAAKMSLPKIGHHDFRHFSCPASGRSVLVDCRNSVFVLDFF